MLSKHIFSLIIGCLVVFIGIFAFANKKDESMQKQVIHFDGKALSVDKFLNETIRLEGIAYNAKAGAVIECDKYHFYIDNLDSWPNGWYGNNVTASGILVKIENNKPLKDKKGNFSQGIQGDYYLLKNATWVKR
jgi:hypothetical protein